MLQKLYMVIGNISCGTHPNFDERPEDWPSALPCRVLPYTIFMTRSEYSRFLYYVALFVEKKLSICRRCCIAVNCYPNGKHSINFDVSSTDFGHLILRDENQPNPIGAPEGFLRLDPGQQVLQLGFTSQTYRALLAMKNLLLWESDRWDVQTVPYPSPPHIADSRERRLRGQLSKVKKQKIALQRKQRQIEYLLLFTPIVD